MSSHTLIVKTQKHVRFERIQSAVIWFMDESLPTLIGDAVVATGGEIDTDSDGPFEAASSSSFSFSNSAAPPFFFFSLANKEDSLSGNGGISSNTVD